MKKWKSLKRRNKVILVILYLFSAYLGIGYLCHLVIFPEQAPNISTYFKPGDTFKSEMEGFTQRVIKQVDGKVYCKLVLDPKAIGPPLHVHTHFDELFENGDDEIGLIVGKDTLTLEPHSKKLIEKGVAHKPFNPHNKELRLEMKEYAFPEEFAFYLTQVYGYADESEENLKPPKVLFQMAMFNQYFDSYNVEQGAPLFIQKTTNFLLVPLARLLGYKSYYEKYDLHK